MLQLWVIVLFWNLICNATIETGKALWIRRLPL